MPAQAGIHLEIVELFQQRWTLAFAGVTTEVQGVTTELQGGDDGIAKKMTKEQERMTFSAAC
jgi:hypothetical protein